MVIFRQILRYFHEGKLNRFTSADVWMAESWDKAHQLLLKRIHPGRAMHLVSAHLSSRSMGEWGGRKRSRTCRQLWLPLHLDLRAVAGGSSPKPRQKKNKKKENHWNCLRRGVCTKKSERIMRVVSWFPREYIVFCGAGPLIIDLNKPRIV